MTITLTLQELQELKQQLHTAFHKHALAYVESLRPFVEVQLIPNFDKEVKLASKKFHEECAKIPASFSI